MQDCRQAADVYLRGATGEEDEDVGIGHGRHAADDAVETDARDEHAREEEEGTAEPESRGDDAPGKMRVCEGFLQRPGWRIVGGDEPVGGDERDRVGGGLRDFGGEIAGHIVGKYPHEQPADPKSLELDIHPDNHDDIFLRDADGNQRHWILELQFIDKDNEIGGYFEQLL